MTIRSKEELDLDFPVIEAQDPKLANPPNQGWASEYLEEQWRDHKKGVLGMFIALLIVATLMWGLVVLMMLAPVRSHSACDTHYAKGGHSSHSTHKGSKHHWFKKTA